MAKKTKIPPKLEKYLAEHGIKHDILEHRTVYTALDAAATMKKKLDEIAKTLLVKADRNYYLVLMSADQNLDFKKLGKCIGAQTGAPVKTVKIPGEKIMSEVLKIKAGALAAFGSLYKLPVFIDKSLAKTKKAVFNSGSFNQSLEITVKDFIALEKAVLGSFSVKKKIKAAKKKPVKKPAKAKKNSKKKK